MASTKEISRADKFRKIGDAISGFKHGDDYDGRDYYTGSALKMCPKRGDKLNREDQEVEGRGTEIPLGPRFKTPQWEHTSR